MLDRDIQNFSADLVRFLNSTDKDEYLQDYEILEERIIEIRDKLNVFDLSPVQKFWETLLIAKGIINRENIFIGGDIDITVLSSLLEIDQNLALKIHRNFNYYQTSSQSNIDLLIELLKKVSLRLEDINNNLFPKIDFRPIYEKKLGSHRNRYEIKFNYLLYKYLSKKDIKAQSDYQDYLDHYKHFMGLKVPLNVLDLDSEHYFIDALNKEFAFLNITKSRLRQEGIIFLPVQIYTRNYDALLKKLENFQYQEEVLQSFLNNNKNRSLLYFKNLEYLTKTFKKWIKAKIEESRPLNDDMEEEFSQYSNQTDTEIEEIATMKTDASSSSGGSGGNKGSRYDGATNEKTKLKVGMVAEIVVYEKLKKIFDNVTWVSKFASKIYKSHLGYNPEGQDDLGYDIEYIDNDGNKFYIEVKGRSDCTESFEITKKELAKANQEGEYFKIFFVTDVLNSEKRRIINLGNIFILENGEDFFSNSRFTAVYRNFEIKFREQ